jgi:type I restriction enzyme S subunit
MHVDLKEVRYLESSEVDEYYVEDGDLLFTRYNGSVDLLGVAGMVRFPTRPTLHPDKLIRVRLVLPAPLPQYVEIASNTGVSRSHIVARARTTAGQTGISGADIREIPIPLCPVDEQTEVVCQTDRVLSVVQRTMDQVEGHLRRALRLRQCILQRAFKGAILPADVIEE